MLFPQNNNYRLTVNLNGLWEFKMVADDYIPFKRAEDTTMMAVPASYNDLVTDRVLKDYVGNVLYEKNIRLHNVMTRDDVYLRIGAACHRQIVYIDGRLVGEHIGGFLPLDLKITEFIKSEFRLSIIIDNRLYNTSIPYGEVKDGKQTIHHDFYNYSGIHRDVTIYSVPRNHIKDIVIKTRIADQKAYVDFEIECNNKASVSIFDQEENLVGNFEGNSGTILVSNPKLWDIGKGNLYTLTASTENDSYSEKFGIRSVEIKGEQILLNGRPIYLKGFGKHEDFFVIGKANNSAVNIRDFNCMKWINANSFRTSHYPYCEEIYDIADREGFLVIDEVPAVGFNFWSNVPVFCEERVNEGTLNTHKKCIDELIKRDKNHPCIIMLSCGNEAASYEEKSGDYFKKIAEYARSLSPWPLMLVENVNPNATKASEYFDVIGLNKYNAWYNNHSEIHLINAQLTADLKLWRDRFHKPLVLTEFGADTIEGNHSLPGESFSEEFQVEYLDEMMKVMDEFDCVVGEHIWNFADFKTKQGLTRVRGNRKGIFTRDRQPKLAAHFVKRRWEKM